MLPACYQIFLGSWSLGFIETDGWLLIVLSGIGLLPFLLARPRDDAKQLEFRFRRLGIFSAAVVAYLTLPVAFAPSVVASNSYFLGTLTGSAAERTGKPIAFDRKVVLVNGENIYLITHAEEFIELTGTLAPSTSGTYSIKGRFTSPSTVDVKAVKGHSGFRDIASIAGLLLVLAWTIAVFVALSSRSLRSYL